MSRINAQPGQIVRFTYHGTNDQPGEQFKEVLVLHPNWLGKMHGLDLKRMTAAQREVLDAVFHPDPGGAPHRLPLVNDIRRRMNVLEEAKNPVSFYNKFVRVFLRTAGDVYRTYDSARMINPTIVKQTDVRGGVTNPKPLFHKV